MMLSPPTVTFTGTGFGRPGKVKVQPDVFPVAVRTYVVVVVSPLIGTAFMFHLPATSARLIAPPALVDVVDAVDGAIALVDDAIALEVSTAAFSFLAHPARTAAQEQSAMRVVR